MKPWRQAIPSLRFESEADERLFAEATYFAWLRNSTIGGILALGFNNAFLLMDYMIGPQVFEVGLHVRLYLCTTVGLVVNALGMAGLRQWIRPTRAVQEAFVVTGSILAGLSILLVAVLSPIHGTLWGLFYHAGLVPILAFGAVKMRLRFRAMCVLTAVILLMHWTTLALTPHVPGAPLVSVMLTVGAPSLFLLIFSYKLELDERERFVQKRRAALLRDELQTRRDALEQASVRDPLTGVANRRGFCAYLDKMASPYAIVLIDIDHFKAYNDGYGHLAGDECLCTVARALSQECMNLRAMLARWGGEEFAIALPLSQTHDLPATAQRLCAAVEQAALPHRHSPTAPIVTISADVAASSAPGATAWSAVFAEADSALYRAKQAGRNRACASAA